MADVLHHHHLHQDARSMDVPPRVYWAAAIGLALLTLLFVFSSTTASNPGATGTYLSEPAIPFTPFVPIL